MSSQSTEPLRYVRPLVGDMPAVILPTGKPVYFGQNRGHHGRGKPDPVIELRESELLGLLQAITGQEIEVRA